MSLLGCFVPQLTTPQFISLWVRPPLSPPALTSDSYLELLCSDPLCHHPLTTDLSPPPSPTPIPPPPEPLLLPRPRPPPQRIPTHQHLPVPPTFPLVHPHRNLPLPSRIHPRRRPWGIHRPPLLPHLDASGEGVPSVNLRIGLLQWSGDVSSRWGGVRHWKRGLDEGGVAGYHG